MRYQPQGEKGEEIAVTRQEQPGRDTEREQTQSQQKMRLGLSLHHRLTPDYKELHILSKVGYRQCKIRKIQMKIANTYFNVNNS